MRRQRRSSAAEEEQAPTSVMLRDGTRVRLFKDGEAMKAAYEAIKLARKRICLETYTFSSDETGMAFADLLSFQARRGRRVHVLYDAVGSIFSHHSMFEKMKHCGVRLQAFHPWRGQFFSEFRKLLKRDHRKILLIDDDIAGLGGLNVGGEYAGSWVVPSSQHDRSWRDTAVGIKGPQAVVLQKVFARMWRYARRGGEMTSAAINYNLTSGEFGVIASAPHHQSRVGDFFKKLLDEARYSIFITMAYFAPTEDIIESLCAAARRGVDVRLMLPGRCDVRLLRIAARSFYHRLLEAGVYIYERQGVVLHAKTLCIDGEMVVIGSTNLDYRSMEHNFECSAIIRSVEFGEQMDLMFRHDIENSRRIRLSRWRYRSTYDCALQWLVNRCRKAL